MTFQDRNEAATRLAEALARYADAPLVLAIPRDGGAVFLVFWLLAPTCSWQREVPNRPPNFMQASAPLPAGASHVAAPAAPPHWFHPHER